jgi:hypothetical protein
VRDYIDAMRRILAEATVLRDSGDPVLSVVGTRIVSIVVDTLLELDPTLTNPWDLLARVDQAEDGGGD